MEVYKGKQLKTINENTSFPEDVIRQDYIRNTFWSDSSKILLLGFLSTIVERVIRRLNTSRQFLVGRNIFVLVFEIFKLYSGTPLG